MLDTALKYVTPLVGCSASCIGTASVTMYISMNTHKQTHNMYAYMHTK